MSTSPSVGKVKVFRLRDGSFEMTSIRVMLLISTSDLGNKEFSIQWADLSYNGGVTKFLFDVCSLEEIDSICTTVEGMDFEFTIGSRKIKTVRDVRSAAIEWFDVLEKWQKFCKLEYGKIIDVPTEKRTATYKLLLLLSLGSCNWSGLLKEIGLDSANWCREFRLSLVAVDAPVLEASVVSSEIGSNDAFMRCLNQILE